MSDEAKIATLVPALQRKASTLVSLCRPVHPIKITQGRRTMEEQAALYAQGRTAPGPRVTNARPGMSWHCWARAFDFAFMGPEPFSEEHPWETVGELGEKLGLHWGGRWKRPDRPHFELPSNFSLEFLAAVYSEGFKSGSSGYLVRELQEELNRWRARKDGHRLNLIAEDGDFGPETAQRVALFQHTMGLETDSVVGPATAAAIEAAIEDMDDE